MPRTMWRGAISFGLVTIPVRVYPATQDKDIHFHQLHDSDHGRIRYKRTCQKCGKEVDYENIVSGYEMSKGKFVVVEDEDLEAIPVRSTRAIDVQQFVELTEIDPIYYQKTYYLIPEEAATKAYHLMRRALEEEGKVGIGKVSFREKEHLAAIRLRDDVLVLETMFWPDEIREAEGDTLDKHPRVQPQELKMAKTLINQLSDKWDPTRFKDEYREAVLEVIEKKSAGEEIEFVESEAPAKVVDLMDALKRSVEEAKTPKPRKKAAASSNGGKRKKKAS